MKSLITWIHIIEYEHVKRIQEEANEDNEL